MVYDKVYELQRAVRESEEYQNLKRLQQKVNEDPNAKKMLDDFRKQSLELQSRQIQGESISQEEVEKMNKLYETIQLHSDIKQLLDAERSMAVLIEDINRIIAEPLKEILGGDE